MPETLLYRKCGVEKDSFWWFLAAGGYKNPGPLMQMVLNGYKLLI